MPVDHRDVEELAEKIFIELAPVMYANHPTPGIVSKAYELAEAFLNSKK